MEVMFTGMVLSQFINMINIAWSSSNTRLEIRSGDPKMSNHVVFPTLNEGNGDSNKKLQSFLTGAFGAGTQR